MASRYYFFGSKLFQMVSFPQFDYDYRKMTEFGHLDLFDLSDSEDETKRADKKIPLPGTRHTDLSERGVNPIICATCLAFSPTGTLLTILLLWYFYNFSQPFKVRILPSSQQKASQFIRSIPEDLTHSASTQN